MDGVSGYIGNKEINVHTQINRRKVKINCSYISKE